MHIRLFGKKRNSIPNKHVVIYFVRRRLQKKHVSVIRDARNSRSGDHSIRPETLKVNATKL